MLSVVEQETLADCGLLVRKSMIQLQREAFSLSDHMLGNKSKNRILTNVAFLSNGPPLDGSIGW